MSPVTQADWDALLREFYRPVAWLVWRPISWRATLRILITRRQWRRGEWVAPW